MAGPAYSRLQTNERRAQLLDAGARVFTKRSYDDASMAEVARAAGISKGLLYHYFPSKRDLFVATLEAAAAELSDITQPDPALPIPDQLVTVLDAAPPVEAIGVAPRSMGQQSHIRIRPEHYERAVAALAAVAV